MFGVFKKSFPELPATLAWANFRRVKLRRVFMKSLDYLDTVALLPKNAMAAWQGFWATG
jgi:hypothetical protein